MQLLKKWRECWPITILEWFAIVSNRIGDQLIVGQKHVPVPEEKEEEPSVIEEEASGGVEPSGEENIIANYLKKQMQVDEEETPVAEAEEE